MISFVTWNSVAPSLRALSHLCFPTNSTSYFFESVNDGFTQMRVNPCSCCAYQPPIDVPITRFGRSFAASSLSIGSPTAGSTGMSGATTAARCAASVSQNDFLSSSTVPLAPDDPNPCR